MHHLSIDIETYSSTDITKAGMYRYAQSPDFQILLFAYSLDGGPVEVVDLTIPETYLPQEVVQRLFDPRCLKHAYNAAFEWYCLSRFFRLPEGPEKGGVYTAETWLPQWRDTMLHGLYCGYTAGLDATGRALGLPEDRRKLSAGRALIKYFCTPCAPTKSNGGRTRNQPRHDPDKWELFKTYNGQDVVTEMEIERRLSGFPVPPEIQRQWELDQRINLRGVAVDLDLMEGALWCGNTIKGRLKEEATALSGLQNPNSVAQLTKWLEKETGEELSDLRKDTVSRLLADGVSSDAASRMLEIRQELGKTSTKKYDALAHTVCADGRVRGLLQFYGANRTGREAGRLVQVQNLPRTYLKALPLARRLVKERNLDGLRLCYGSVPSTLSQLIRTTLVAAPGKVFIDADFSAIEARMIAWLAGEEWALQVFRTTGKIYEATAAQMFHVPEETIAKGRENYGMRQKGKVATLALGYQGGIPALQNMRKTYGIPESELPDRELPDIRDRWRKSNPHIVQYWYDVEKAALDAVSHGRPSEVRGIGFARECDPGNGLDFLTIRLPCGRKLYYAHPHMGVNRFGGPSLCYWGLNQTTRKWEVQDAYGGRLVENISQAVARDCLFAAMERLEQAGYEIVFDIHDEVVIEAPEGTASLEAVAEIMSQPIPWAPGLPLAADGWIDHYFKKD